MRNRFGELDLAASAAALLLLLFAVLAVLAPLVAPHDPTASSLSARLLPPIWSEGGQSTYLLGTDQLGRDVLSRLIYGARVSLAVGVAAVLMAGAIGTALGITAGYLGGFADQVIMRVVDAWMAMPSLVFAIFLAAMVGQSAINVVLILGLVYWTRYARLVRGEVLSLRERDFVKLAVVTGASSLRIMVRHILPNVVNTTVVLATLMLGVVIVTEASLSFLGVGVPPPNPAWGLMLADGKQAMMVGKWWLTVLPGACILLTVMSASILGDYMRDRFDPKGKMR
ncbi:MAG TPA: ABC transporter permease [Amaricoccus sp.]|uniref:ABC transporter permease n=1 Tax=Amaricoccus sp. TaxID=1872485 RepID=UPI001E107B12|nr:ABC transporter permease [Amaricoccus sp.]MCB1401865.1 ABC transporter permease [Paracoccaceae bacterium]HPG21326.1 ABC transporter permease [Amaricoccus sp.]HRW15981.1 ABC transporter permease [Amaricoccus sp.]